MTNYKEYTYNGKTATIDRHAPIVEISDTLVYELDVPMEVADSWALRIAR